MNPLEPHHHQRQLARAYRRLRYCPEATGVSIGLKEVDGVPINSIVPRLHVSVKLPLSKVATPFHELMEMDSGEVDVIESSFVPFRLTGDYTPIPALRKLSDVIHPGLGIGPERKLHAGTLGAIVYDIADGWPGILTNWHVVQPNQIGDYVMQPGGLDDMNAGRPIATLTRQYIGDDGDFAFCRFLPDFVNRHEEWFAYDEASIANKIDPIIPTWAQISTKTDDFRYFKVGMTTGLTEQICTAIGIFGIAYGGDKGNVFMHGFELRPQPTPTYEDNVEGSAPGDSGSAILVEKRRGKLVQVQQAGVLVGGESSGIPSEERTICCDAWRAARILGVVWEANQLKVELGK